MNTKLKVIIKELNKGLIEREEHIRMCLLALLSNENIVLIGPPGTAKSQMSRSLAEIIKNGTYFEYLLTKFTTPEELFGPISIKELEKDIFKRKTKGYLTNSNIVFLDEIFKANSSILNALLTILNERLYHNGSEREETDILSIVATSNELPLGENELEALYDRFLFKKEVLYVKNTKALFNLEKNSINLMEEYKLTKDEINTVLEESNRILIPEDIQDKILSIKNEIEKEFGLAEYISDRRLVKSLKVLKVAVYTSGRRELSIFDLLLLENFFWQRPENIPKIQDIIIKEILGISKFQKEKLEDIYEKWFLHFNKLFEEQRKNKKGEPLFLQDNGEVTTDTMGEIHLRDNLGNYIFYKGYREHVKILSELGKFDNGFIDSGIKTLDKKVVWKYEFSPVKVRTKHNNEDMEGFKKLTLNGQLNPYMINTYKEYRDYYKKSKGNIKGLLEEIERNVLDEKNLVNSIYMKLKDRQEYLQKASIEAIWISKSELDKVQNIIDEKVEENFNLLNAYTDLINQIREAKE